MSIDYTIGFIKGDIVKLFASTKYGGKFSLPFEVINVMPNHHYVLMAQCRIVVGHWKENDDWILSKPIDFHDMKPITDKFHEMDY